MFFCFYSQPTMHGLLFYYFIGTLYSVQYAQRDMPPLRQLCESVERFKPRTGHLLAGTLTTTIDHLNSHVLFNGF